jgi:putative endonuclease
VKKYKQELGKQGEGKSAEFLQGQGFVILERNYRFGHKEIDLVGREENTIVFVEVKAGRSKSFGAPEERVNLRKQKNLIQAALHYIQEKEISGCDFRFDVLAISYRNGKEVIDHIRNAFVVT